MKSQLTATSARQKLQRVCTTKILCKRDLSKLSKLILFLLQDCPESPTHLDHPVELHSSNIQHHPTPVLSAGAHSRVSVASSTQPFSPFSPFTPPSAIKPRAHAQALSPAFNWNRAISPTSGE